MLQIFVNTLCIMFKYTVNPRFCFVLLIIGRVRREFNYNKKKSQTKNYFCTKWSKFKPSIFFPSCAVSCMLFLLSNDYLVIYFFYAFYVHYFINTHLVDCFSKLFLQGIVIGIFSCLYICFSLFIHDFSLPCTLSQLHRKCTIGILLIVAIPKNYVQCRTYTLLEMGSASVPVKQ